MASAAPPFPPLRRRSSGAAPPEERRRRQQPSWPEPPHLGQNPARSFEIGFTTPDRTLEKAETVVKIHLGGLPQLRPLVESQARRQLQLPPPQAGHPRYHPVQARSQRPALRKIYTPYMRTFSVGSEHKGLYLLRSNWHYRSGSMDGKSTLTRVLVRKKTNWRSTLQLLSR